MDLGLLISDAEPLIRQYGVLVVTIVLTLESFGAPLPGESLLIVASVLAGRGDISFPVLLFFAWLGAVLGDNIGYVIGKVLGRAAVLRYGEKIGLTPDRLKKIEEVFARFGPATVAFARFVNILRQLNGVVAGTLNMDWWRFLICNALGLGPTATTARRPKRGSLPCSLRLGRRHSPGALPAGVVLVSNSPR